MESIKRFVTNKSLIRAVSAEFMGTLLFVFIGCGSVVAMTHADIQDTVNASICFGFTLAVIISSIANVSGGHLNPALTYAFMLTGNIGTKQGLLYIVAQILGGVFGSLLLRGVTGTLLTQGVGVNALGPGVNVAQGIYVEAVLTFLLIFTVYNVAVRKATGAYMAPVIIGFAVTCSHFASVTLTGTSLNPARSFGPALVQNYWQNQYVFWIGPLLGATLTPIVLMALYGTVQPGLYRYDGDEDVTFRVKALAQRKISGIEPR